MWNIISLKGLKKIVSDDLSTGYLQKKLGDKCG